MAVNFTITNLEKNKITISNLDLVSVLLYKIEYYDSTVPGFIPVTGYTTTPNIPIAPGANVIVDLIKDNVYKITFVDTINVNYYFIVDYNLRSCRKKYIKKILCPSTDPCLDPCIATYDYMRFKVIENNIYFIWNKWVQSQSVTDLITPPDNELLSESDWLSMVNIYCTDCVNDCDCGCSESTLNSKLNCGCS